LGLAYSNPDRYLKLQSSIEREPSILVLGTSRSMPFRSMFFKDSAKFYNASGGVETIRDFAAFFQQIPGGLEPKIVIIGLDQYFFNDAFDTQKRSFEKPLFGAVWQKGIKGLLRDYAQKKFGFSDIFAAQGGVQKIGLAALVKNSGFLNDGSYHYGTIIEPPPFEDTLQRIEQGNRRFQYGQEASKDAVLELERFLQLAKERNIYVIGFLPPYAHSVYERMMEMGNKYAYIASLPVTLQPFFDINEFALYDFSDLAEFGADDAETIDGFHGSEKAYLRLFINMAQDNKILQEYVDTDYLKEKLNTTQNPHYVFEITEN
jgi:hypothetical protein